jgi:hypothetical protein
VPQPGRPTALASPSASGRQVTLPTCPVRGASRCGSESVRGTRLAVEAASGRATSRRHSRVPNERERRYWWSFLIDYRTELMRLSPETLALGSSV